MHLAGRRPLVGLATKANLDQQVALLNARPQLASQLEDAVAAAEPPSTAVSYATSCSLSRATTRRKVASGSAARQWSVFGAKVALSPFFEAVARVLQVAPV